MPETFLALRAEQVNYSLFLSDFNETLIFSRDFRKLLSTKFHENPSSGWVLFFAEGQTDGHDEDNSHFSHFYLIDFVMTGVEM